MTVPVPAPESIRAVADEWYERCATVAVGHYKTAERLLRKHRMLSGWSAGLSALVGAAVFGTLQSQPELWFKVAAGLTSVVAAVLATLAASMGTRTGLKNIESRALGTTRLAGRLNCFALQLKSMSRI